MAAWCGVAGTDQQRADLHSGLKLQFESVAIVVRGKFAAELGQMSRAKRCAEHPFCITGFAHRIAEIVQYLAVAAVGITLAVFTHPIHSGDVAEILDRTRG